MFLVSTVTQFLLIALVVLAVLLGSTVGYFYFRARRSEAGALTDDERAELRKRDQELATIRNRLDEISWRQQTGAETQHQVVNQHLEKMGHELQARGRQIEGLHGQLKYEMAQRQEQIDELRRQLHEVVQVVREGGQLPAASRAQLAAPVAPSASPSESAAADEFAQPEPALATRAATQETSSTEQPPSAAADDPVASRAIDSAVTPPDADPAGARDENQPWHLPIEQAQPEPKSTAPEQPEQPDAHDSHDDVFTWEPIELNFDMKEAEGDTAGGDREEEEREDLLSLFNEALDARKRRPSEPPAGDPLPPAFEPVATFLTPEPPPQNRPEPTPDPETASPTPIAEEDDPFEGVVQWTTLEPVKPSGTDAFGDTGDATAKETPAMSVLGDLPSFQPTASAPPPFEPDFAAFEAQYSSGDGMGSDYRSEPEPPKSRGEDLTSLPMITAERQQALHKLGVKSVEEIARFSRADARRVAEAIRDVNEDIIMNDWVFAAQSVLFDRYQDELRTRRTRSL